VLILEPCHVPVAIVPTLVKLEAVTPLARVAPDNVPAAAVTVIAALPLKFTPLIALAVASTVAVAALPVVEPELPLTFPVKAAVIVPALKLPEASLRTILLAVFALVAVIVAEFACEVIVAALPVVEPELPLTLPVKLAVIVPALKLPEASRETIAFAVFAFVAFDVIVYAVPPSVCNGRSST
jgi:hypothetical protein